MCVCVYVIYCLMYVQDKGNVLLLSVGSIQRNLHWLLREVQTALTEEMRLHLIVENYDRRNRQLAEGQLNTLDTLFRGFDVFPATPCVSHTTT